MKRETATFEEIAREAGAEPLVKAEVRFGGMRLLQTTAEIMRHRPHRSATVKFSADMDRTVASLFERERTGASPERLMWDRPFAKRFVRLVRSSGIHAPDWAIKQRIIQIRKNKDFYAKRGIVLSSTRSEARVRFQLTATMVPAAEFALANLYAEHGVSVDRILLDDRFGDSFEKLGREVLPGAGSKALRLAALYVRKTRTASAVGDVAAFADSVSLVAARMGKSIRLTQLKPVDHPVQPGLFELVSAKDPQELYYVYHTPNIAASCELLASASTIEALEEDFLFAESKNFALRYIADSAFPDKPRIEVQNAIIKEQRPMLNYWPGFSVAA